MGRREPLERWWGNGVIMFFLTKSLNFNYLCTLMRKLAGLIIWGIVFLVACKSEFEKIRTSNDPPRIYKQALTYYQEGDYQRALTLIELVINNYRGQKEYEDLNYMLADTYFKLKDYELASTYFKNFANGFLNSARREEADYMSAYSLYLQSPIFRLDQANTLKAMTALQVFINNYPESKRVSEVTKLMDELREKQERKAFDEGLLYFNLKRHQAAIHSFENMLKDFPETKRAEEARYYIFRSAYDYAANSIVDRQSERYQDASKKAEDYLRRYRSGDRTKEVQELQREIKIKLKS